MLYISDQMAFQDELNELMENGYTIICDRYDLSTIIYYSIIPGKTLKDANNKIYKNFQSSLIKPDITIILGLEPEEISKRIDNLDIFEKNIEGMRKANNHYLNLAFKLEDREILYLNGAEAKDKISETINKHVMEYIKRRNFDVKYNECKRRLY